jgi:hypothetical protein
MKQELKPWQRTAIIGIGTLMGTIIAGIIVAQLEK